MASCYCDFCEYDSPQSNKSPQCKTCIKHRNFKVKKRMTRREAYKWEQYKLYEALERGINMSVKVCCDFCNQPLDYEVKDGKKRFIFYNTKELNTRDLLPCLCKRCADGLDDIIRLSRTRLLSQAEIVQEVTELNKARRERLGTKG